MTTRTDGVKQRAMTDTLRSCPLFAGVPLPELGAIATFSVIKSIPKGGYLFREGDPSHGFYIVQAGAINVHRVNASGKEQVIRVFRTGDSFAEGTLATDEGYPADARAVEASQVLLVRKSGILELLRHQPDLALRMLASMSSHLRVLVGQLEDLTLKDVETRLANWLIKRCKDPRSETPTHIDLGMTKRVLAAELGTASETLSRSLAKFREQELVAVKGKKLTILCPARLNALLRKNLGE